MEESNNKHDPEKVYSPVKAIHAHCMECVGGSLKMLDSCGGRETCPLYPYRKGHRPRKMS